MTQSIAFILCDSEELAKKYLQILEHPLYIFINNICRWVATSSKKVDNSL